MTLRHAYVAIVACAVMCGTSLAYQEPSACLDADGEDMGVQCVYVDVGLTCPKNYYCPTYTVGEAATYMTVLSANECTVSSGLVQCPCPPGFYCPADMGQPTYCPAGYYCPADSSAIATATSAGLGAWGGVAKICPEGNFCALGQVEPLECSAVGMCEEGAEKEYRGLVYILAALLFIILYCGAFLYEFREANARELRRTIQTETQKRRDVGGKSAPDSHGPMVRALKEMEFELQAAVGSDDEEPNPIHLNRLPSNTSYGADTSSFDGTSTSTNKSNMYDSFDIKFDKISFVLKDGKTIMKNVDGEFRSGRTCAIMGPSGAGKTTIINLITGKAPKTGGVVRVNGEEVPNLSKFKRLIGFVPQEDVMIRNLTVRDNIAFSAGYRLPVDDVYDDSVRRSKINDCIHDLGMDHVQDSLIGDERTRGISGGQRKRVNIGIELVADPMVLFLDEPTSGLDSTSSTSLCQMLKTIAVKRRMTIAAVIHQPSISAFEAFDDLLLLGKGGRVVYHGPVDEAEAYFTSIGFPTPANCNPADFYMDVCQGEVPHLEDAEQNGKYVSLAQNTTKTLKFDWPLLFDMWEEHICPDVRSGKVAKGVIERLATWDTRNDIAEQSKEQEKHDQQAWYDMPLLVVKSGGKRLYDMLESGATSHLASFRGICATDLSDEVRLTPSAWRQFVLCFRRAVKQEFVPMTKFINELLIHLVVGAAFSGNAATLFYEGPYPDPICAVTPGPFIDRCQQPLEHAYQDSASIMCFGVLTAGIATGSAVFGHEQVNYFRESAAGLKTFPYFMAKVLANLPKLILASLLFWTTFSSKFQDTGGTGPGSMYLLLLLLYWCAFGLGYLICQLTPMKNAALLGTFVALAMVVSFAGLDPTMKDIGQAKPITQLPYYLSAPRWINEGFYVLQVLYYDSIPGGHYEGQDYIDVDTGLSPRGYSLDWVNNCYLGLFVSGLLWHVVALYIMLTCNRDKKL